MYDVAHFLINKRQIPLHLTFDLAEAIATPGKISNAKVLGFSFIGTGIKIHIL